VAWSFEKINYYLEPLMVKHPDLMQRPIVGRGERAVLDRPVDNVRNLL